MTQTISRRACFCVASGALLASRAQAQALPSFMVTQKSTAVTSEVITVHLPSANPAIRSVQFDGASVYSSVECEFTLERDGTLPTVPTSVALAIVKLNDGDIAPTVIAFRSSNVGTSTVLGRYVVPAGGTMALDLKDKGLKPGENLTIRIASSSSGTYIVNIKGREF